MQLFEFFLDDVAEMFAIEFRTLDTSDLDDKLDQLFGGLPPKAMLLAMPLLHIALEKYIKQRQGGSKQMQRGYAICTTDLSRILTIAPCKTKFIFVPITSGQVLTDAICFTDISNAKTIESRAKKKFEGMPETRIVNVALLYNRIDKQNGLSNL